MAPNRQKPPDSRCRNRPLRVFVATLLTFAALFVGTVPVSGNESVDNALRDTLIAAINDAHSFTDRFEAEVWLLDMSERLRARLRNHQERISLLRLIHQEALRARLPPELVLAVIDVESGFDRWAISSAGAQGLMQVMPFWLDELGHREQSLHNPPINLRLGCTILRYYLDMEAGDLKRALARYNGSAGRMIYPEKVLEALRTRWFRQ